MIPLLSPAALLKVLVSRALPAIAPDGAESERAIRGGRYGEPYLSSVVRKAHLLADEGSYFVVNNAQTGIVTSPAVAFVATTPSILIVNNDSAGGKRLYLDYIELMVTTAGATGTATQAKRIAAVIDSIQRYTSGGTNMTTSIVSPNMDVAARSSIANVYMGAITAAAASTNARTIVGQRMVRLPVTATTVPDTIGDRVRIEFGSVESLPSVVIGSTAVLQALCNQETLKFPPVVLGPGHSLLIYLWQLVAGGTYDTATAYAPEIGWWER